MAHIVRLACQCLQAKEAYAYGTVHIPRYVEILPNVAQHRIRGNAEGIDFERFADHTHGKLLRDDLTTVVSLQCKIMCAHSIQGLWISTQPGVYFDRCAIIYTQCKIASVCRIPRKGYCIAVEDLWCGGRKCRNSRRACLAQQGKAYYHGCNDEDQCDWYEECQHPHWKDWFVDQGAFHSSNKA